MATSKMYSSSYAIRLPELDSSISILRLRSPGHRQTFPPELTTAASNPSRRRCLKPARASPAVAGPSLIGQAGAPYSASRVLAGTKDRYA